jgi:hypothetical protein
MCVCDSSWSVGIGAGQVQVAEFFGPDCSYRKYADVLLMVFAIAADCLALAYYMLLLWQAIALLGTIP